MFFYQRIYGVHFKRIDNGPHAPPISTIVAREIFKKRGNWCKSFFVVIHSILEYTYIEIVWFTAWWKRPGMPHILNVNKVNFLSLTFYRIHWKGLHSASMYSLRGIERRKKNHVLIGIRIVNSILCKPSCQVQFNINF